mmetsp:Transcript_14348/g.25058  ORF Transcript_14348/g.25058 Transcript_14348/m.25058 type:complete len:208 (-) Transcript_14348:1098-1721(-)
MATREPHHVKVPGLELLQLMPLLRLGLAMPTLLLLMLLLLIGIGTVHGCNVEVAGEVLDIDCHNARRAPAETKTSCHFLPSNLAAQLQCALSRDTPCAAAHSDKLLCCTWMNADGAVKDCLGCACLQRHSNALHDFWSIRTHHVNAHNAVTPCMHNHLHQGLLITPTHGVLHGTELGHIHIQVACELGNGLLLTVAHSGHGWLGEHS